MCGSPGVFFFFFNARAPSALPQWCQHIVNYIKTQLTVTSNTDDVVLVPLNQTAKGMPADSFDWKGMLAE